MPLTMPRLPNMPGKVSRQIISFRGINYGAPTSDGELSDSSGMSSRRFPFLSQRAGRKTFATYDNPHGLYARGELCVVDGTDFIYGGEIVGTVTPGEKQFATINTKIVILPDKVFYDTFTGQFKSLDAKTIVIGNVTFTSNTLTVQSSNPMFSDFFEAGDSVEISGCVTFPLHNGSHIIRSLSGWTLTFDPDIFTAGTELGEVTIARRVPSLTVICESDNRIWGAEGNTIYASALGDPRNFFLFDGLSTDSYAVAVGTDGDFTGCVRYSSAVLFWKEDCLHKILGTMPGNYEMSTLTVPGLHRNSHKSLCVINETLYYKGRAGVYAYGGGIPELISANFSTRRFSDAVAGSDGVLYYISMRDEGGRWGLYVFDTLRGIWLREDDTRASDFAELDGVLYYLDHITGRVLMTGQDDSEEGRVSWSATLCPFDETTHGRKGYSKLYLRARLDAGAWFSVDVRADGAPFSLVYSSHDHLAKTVVVPIRPVRCDNFQIRIHGKGGCDIQSLVREFSIGSEV